MKTQIVDPSYPNCPVRNVIGRIGNKWSLLVLLTLNSSADPLRYKELEQRIPDISQRMQSVTLRDLEADGLVARRAYAEIPPRVEYALTTRAITLLPHLMALVGWAVDNIAGILADRQAYAQRAK